MLEQHTFTSAIFAELSRRRVPRTVGAYAVGVFAVLQLMDAAVEPLRLPDWLPTLIVVVLILGFPLVFLLAWQFDLTAGGIRKATASGSLSRAQNTLLFGCSLLAMVGLGYGFYVHYSGVFDSPAAVAGDAREFTAPVNSIAVLPFSDLSAEGNQAYLSDGIAEEILNLLAQVKGLDVAARTSSFAFRNPQTDIREIGRLLNVRTVLEGSIRSAGNRIRLTAQLINVDDGYHIWSKTYDRQLDDIFAMQDEIASSIAKALVQSFTGLEQKSVGKTDNIAAANAYRTGRLHWWRRTPASLERALGFFAEALEQDAGFAPAYAAMGDTWMLLSLYGNVTPMKAAEKAQPMIEKALAIDPESAEAFAALGLARWRIGQYDSAESSLRRATELNEDYIPAQLWLAGVLADLGRYPEEYAVLEHAMRLDPLNELLAVNYAENHRMRGDFATARQMMQKLIDLRPDSTMLLRSLSAQDMAQGELVEGWKLAHRAWLLEPDNPADTAALAKTWMALGEMDEAEKLLTAGLDKSSQNFILLDAYWLNLLVTRRFEEAERLAREVMADAGEDPPAALQRMFKLHLGMIALAKQDLPTAAQYLDLAISAQEKDGFDNDEILTLTLASMVAQRLGNDAQAAALLDKAERKLARSRLNGVDSPDIYYAEAAVSALRGATAEALDKLQQAYDRGFRELWLLAMDWRWDGVRNEAKFVDLSARMRQDIDQALAEIRSLGLAVL
jgi:TolB-like protein/Flp pilus assembly protein TadD